MEKVYLFKLTKIKKLMTPRKTSIYGVCKNIYYQKQEVP